MSVVQVATEPKGRPGQVVLHFLQPQPVTQVLMAPTAQRLFLLGPPQWQVTTVTMVWQVTTVTMVLQALQEPILRARLA